tara:strand:- start:189 stop:515 length:327 start_codon:yes stop_codon:yes gene_type:complete
MRKPTSFKFGHRRVKIKYISDKKANKLGIFGQIEPSKNEIVLDKTLKPTQLINTLLHESVHLIADHYHWNLPAKEEEMVSETVINGLCDLLSQNPKLLDYLAYSLKKD